MQTMQQKRAKYALDQVNAAITNGVNQKEYRAHASNLPAMIHMNGLGQAAAFFKSKGGTHGELYNLLSGWLCQQDQPYAGCANLLAGITSEDMHKYRLAQAEAQMLMDWVKKFAKAFMTDGDSGGQQQ
ncbi:MAG: type III-B CRISPR module-associated protein Cmr5 [Gammaproteobacteria bacterium]|nr:type III-B CRISPR module-associated protein Cmr5 [Gammaproteobacteria bacterium]MBU1723881.1 type III-B CRISPR module-associated protein Cmr5 [Gammaproteobacteria bacterium]MBU2006210.1 type III-B CRISPR module-associated protein Cmr5 [Gammaproteobacteria bacterium]